MNENHDRVWRDGRTLVPGLAIAETLAARGHQAKLLVSQKAVDQAALAGSMGFSSPLKVAVQAVPAVGYAGARQLIHFCCRLAQAARDCARACEDFEPDVVLGMGGFTSAPAVLAARWFRRNGTRTLIHESNAVPGKANRCVGWLTDHVAVGMADCARFFGSKPVTVTGTPMRAALRLAAVARLQQRSRREDGHERLGLDSGRLTVLVAGGSQGAHAINEAMVRALPWLGQWRNRVQFVHLSGTRDEPLMREAYEKNEMKSNVMGFYNQMEWAYGAADLAIGRSGAATLTEIAAFGLPSILVPYPHAAGDHQRHNARVFERAGAAQIFEQPPRSGDRAETGEQLAETMSALLGDDARRARMAAAARSLAVTDAEERVAALIERYAH